MQPEIYSKMTLTFNNIKGMWLKTTGSLDIYHIHSDFGMASVNVLPVEKHGKTNTDSQPEPRKIFIF